MKEALFAANTLLTAAKHLGFVKSIKKNFQKAVRAVWVDARKGLGVQLCVYIIGCQCPGGHRDARKSIGV